MSQCTANISLDSILKSNLFLFNPDLNRRCLVYMFSLRFSRRKFLINLRRQFRARKFFRVREIFRTQGFVGFTVF